MKPNKRRKARAPGSSTAQDDDWYASPAGLLSTHPLSAEASAIRSKLPLTDANTKTKFIRKMFKHLDVTIPHSVEYKAKWHSLSLDQAKQYYNERRVHMVGERRMIDWSNSLAVEPDDKSPGAAVAFWYSLDEATCLPDAIQVGLESTTNGEFAEVYLLTYKHQSFSNVPDFVKILDCEEVSI